MFRAVRFLNPNDSPFDPEVGVTNGVTPTAVD